MISFCLPPHS